MPYAASDRQEFIKRSDLKTDARIFDLGGTLSDELPSAISGIAKPRKISNAVLTRPALLPFKNSVFDGAICYHYFDLISQEMLTYVFSEIARVLKKDSAFTFMITFWSAQNEPQRSNLLFNEALRFTGALYPHEFESVNLQLSNSGFGEITVETVKREIQIPEDFIKSHVKMLGGLIKKEKEAGGTEIRMLARRYFEHAKEHGESMLPALHFIAKKL